MKKLAREVSTIAARILIELWRTRRSLIFWGVFPALMLVLFGLIFAGDGAGGNGTAGSFDRTAPGILVGAALFFSCLGGPIALIVAERERRTLRRVLLSPLNPVSYFLGIVTAFLVVALGQTVIVYGIAALFGARFHGAYSLGVLIVVLSVFCYVGLGFLFGAHFAKRAEDVNGPVAAFGVPLLVLGGTFFSVSILPEYLLVIDYANPVFHMNQALKAVSAEARGAGEIGVHLAFLAGFTLVSLLLGIRSYKTLLKQEKRG